MSTLGKRKERENQGEEQEKQHHGSTLFVSNLPYTATSTDLKTLFSDIAPVRTAFVVLEHGTGISKGVGYVSFAIREDATMAIDKISKEGITLDGRSLRVQWAGSKNKDHEQGNEPKEKAAKPAAPKPAKPAAPSNSLAIRTVVLSGLPTGIDSKALWKKIRKLSGAEKVEWPVKSDSGQEDATLAHAIFETPANAMEAVNKLHAHVFKGSLLSATLKKRLDSLAKVAKAKPAKPSAQQKSVFGPAPNRNSRLIVRNLPFDITEQDLRAIFLPYGPIYSIHIPLTSDVKPEEGVKADEGSDQKPQVKQRSKGFAFVWFLSRKDAEKAMEGCNGTEVEAGMAEALVSDKQKKKKQRREEKKLKAKAKNEDGEGGEDEDEDDETDENRRKRTIAVDWALSKDKWEAEKAKVEEALAEEEHADVDMKDEEGSESSEGGSGESDSDEQLGVHDGDSDDSHSNSDGSDSDSGEDDDEEKDQKPAKPTLPAPEVGTTVFVRNVPFEATDDELRTLFRAFGPLRYARITMDHATGRSRGTGFACFWNKEDADKAIEQSDILRAETVGNEPAVTTKKNPFKLPSLLTPDPSASIARNLVLHGRTLDVSRAVTRDEASKLKEAGERQREKADKRNLYLLREGIILPNSPAAELLPPAEVEKRTQSFNARRALLRSNPSLFVSRTRLSVRQIPLFVSERMLKRLAIHSIRAFEKEAKEGKRGPLSADELIERALTEDADDEDVKMEAEDDSSSKPKKGKHDVKGKGRNTGVKQAKIVRQQDRVDAVTGKGRSRGYGFLELTKHADALRVLRWANNNPVVGRLFEEWWKAELEDLIATEKKKPEGKRDETRMKRIREEIEKGVPPKSKSALIVEFSIENIQVVQRRAAKTGSAGKEKEREKGAKGGKEQKAAGGDKKVQRRKSLPSIKTEEAEAELEDRPKKKRRVSDPLKPSATPAKGKQDQSLPAEPPKQVGSLIGRKRKERKMKKVRGK
ncbi:RNA-binding domain-containing protein [Dichomitus squalens]|uniref:RNA-binding domain-containing protein n=1 Tax=Dichomitus squalens TaxID=114155 RepID=A0A4Q9PMZ8_9APHY|nr:RNA-binding domain-containing protein [Dichomitus squalens]